MSAAAGPGIPPQERSRCRPEGASLVLVLLLLLLALVAGLRSPPDEERRLPAAVAEPWMAQALPGIGPKRRQAAAAAIRAWRLDELPATARGLVPQLFVAPEAQSADDP